MKKPSPRPTLQITPRLILAVGMGLVGLAVFIFNPIPITRNSFGTPIINGAVGGLLVGFGIAVYLSGKKA